MNQRRFGSILRKFILAEEENLKEEVMTRGQDEKTRGERSRQTDLTRVGHGAQFDELLHREHP